MYEIMIEISGMYRLLYYHYWVLFQAIIVIMRTESTNTGLMLHKQHTNKEGNGKELLCD